MPPELDASSADGGDDSVETLSKDSERRSGDVDCCACRSAGREREGRLDEVRDLLGVGVGVCVCTKSLDSVFGGVRVLSRCCLGVVRAGALDSMGAAGSKFSGLSFRLGAPTSRLARLSSKRCPALVGVLGGVARAASISGSS